MKPSTLANRIYKRASPDKTKRGALHQTIPALVWKLRPPDRLCLFSLSLLSLVVLFLVLFLLAFLHFRPCNRSTAPLDGVTMCYFEQTRWSCGYWRWGHFKQQCNKEYRMGETCGLKLVYHTIPDPDVCRLCHDREKKERRLSKMVSDVERWQKEGNRSATIERTEGEMAVVREQICAMQKEHAARQFSLAQ
ncbi:hypothetical protein TgHK011_010131 [Trichoderma gracile]|nr:hypothetical protein TgHK011_010131 [Trichoderma gracile]